jgi:hypothetical protein
MGSAVMALGRVTAELPEGVESLCLVRFGLVVRRLSALGFARRMARRIEAAAAEATRGGAGLFCAERFAMGWRHFGTFQYWASFEALDTWSRRPPHAEWWREALERMRARADFGIYHEAFVVARRDVESIYLGCPPIGLSAFGSTSEPVGPRTTARDRLGRRTG